MVVARVRRVADHNVGAWAPRSFATRDPLPDDGEPRFPRPSRLETPLKLPGEKAEKAGERLGLHTVGDLLEHVPRDRRAARTIGELAIDEVATVVVEVRTIKSRPVRRRGMKPLVEARVADETGTMVVTFFNQPWLERRYRPGTRLLLHRQVPGPSRLPGQRTRRDRRAGGRPARTWRPTPRPRG